MKSGTDSTPITSWSTMQMHQMRLLSNQSQNHPSSDSNRILGTIVLSKKRSPGMNRDKLIQLLDEALAIGSTFNKDENVSKKEKATTVNKDKFS